MCEQSLGERPQLMLQLFPHQAAHSVNANVPEEGQTWSIFGGESSEQVTRPLAVTPRAVTLGICQLVVTWCFAQRKKPLGCKHPSAFLGVTERGLIPLKPEPASSLSPSPSAQRLGGLYSLSIPNCTHPPSKSTYCCSQSPGYQGRGRELDGTFAGW